LAADGPCVFAINVLIATSELNLAGEKTELCLTDRFDIRRQNACARYQN
jgi:hypothetical protein